MLVTRLMFLTDGCSEYRIQVTAMTAKVWRVRIAVWMSRSDGRFARRRVRTPLADLVASVVFVRIYYWEDTARNRGIRHGLCQTSKLGCTESHEVSKAQSKGR
jgi:hypothetical protein